MFDLLYYAMVGAFFTHEMDAVKRHEWRLLPMINALSERAGEQVFIWGHVPLFGVLLWGGDGNPTSATRLGLSAFAIIHAGLHVLYLHHPKNEFTTPGAWALILLPGLLGAATLSVVFL